MEYQVTARKWRPQTFGEVIGQEHVTRALTNALSSGKIPHAFLFSGPRGVGKTTTARILAKALNCDTGITAEPCNQCAVCVDIMSGNSLDVREIDGASNRGIDNIREVRDTVAYMPLKGRYKIYIIDEVHMLTLEASNALLKTLEEPPEHVIFMLATTEPHKVIPTIRSRCQHYVFKKIPASVIVTQLKNISDKEKIHATEEGLFLIADAADGSMRDGQSIYDQIVLYSDGNITEKTVIEVLGIPDEEYFKNVTTAIIRSDSVRVLEVVHDYLENFGDIPLFVKHFIDYMKKGLLVRNLPREHEMVDLSEKRYQETMEVFQPLTNEEITRIIQIMVNCYTGLRSDLLERFVLENALFKALDYKNMIPLAEIRNEIVRLAAGNTGSNIPREMPAVKQAIPAPAETPPPDNKPVAYKKLEPKPVEFVPAAVKSTDNVNDTVRRILQKNPLRKSMSAELVSIEEMNNTIRVRIGSAHSVEFFNSRAGEIAKDMETETGKTFQFIFENSTAGNATAVESPEREEIKAPVTHEKPAPETKPVNEGNPDSGLFSVSGLLKDKFDAKIDK
ncbi:MAG: DNA polymerase III subunit gamma/tau [Brevinematales bacterium]|nr:DNA polymerase III subunit gamma/tau [Brevinematales bacterium]